jgi:hypothetical protein
MVSSPKIDMLRRDLGAGAEKVSFADMAEVGRNPGRIIAAWHAFAQAHAGTAQLYGIGGADLPGTVAGGDDRMDWARTRPPHCWWRSSRLPPTATATRAVGGELRAWSDGQALICEISDRSRLTWPLAGRLPPGADAGVGAGLGDDLWLANQLCDLVQLYSSPGRATIRLHQYV